MSRQRRTTKNLGRPAQPRESNQSNGQTTRQSVAVSASWAGPLPPPAALEHFNKIVPNGAERIFKMAEKEQEHRVALETSGQIASIAEARRGQLAGAFISILAVGLAGYLAYVEADPWVSVALVSLPVMSVAGAFIRASRSSKKD